MTTPDIAGLCERLLDNARYASESEMQAQIRRLAARTEAADTLERQAAEIERLRGALGPFAELAKCIDDAYDDSFAPSFAPFNNAGEIRAARAALTGEEN